MEEEPTIVVKKYSNRRLYHTGEKRYITLEQIGKLIRQGNQVKVIDNQSKQEITQDTLLQIILNSDNKSQNLFSSTVLHKLIRLQEDHFQEFIKFYLGAGLDHFTKFKQNMANQFGFWGQFWEGLIPQIPFIPKENKALSEAKDIDIHDLQQRMLEYEKKIKELEEKLEQSEKEK